MADLYGGSPQTQPVNLTQLDTISLGAPSTYGVAPSGNVIGVNAFITNTVAVTLAEATFTTSSGSPAESSLNVNVTGGIVTFDNNSPANPLYVSDNIIGINGYVVTTAAEGVQMMGLSDGFGNPISSTSYGSPAVHALDVYVVSPISVSFPASLPVTQATTPWVVSGTLAVSNFPTVQTVSGTVSVSNLSFTAYGSPAVEAANVYVVNPLTFPSSLSVTQGTSPWVSTVTNTVNTSWDAVEAAAPVTATWTSGTAVNTTLAVPTVGFASCFLSVGITGTVTGGVLEFDASPDGGTTWVELTPYFNVHGPSYNPSGNTYPLTAGSSFQWIMTSGFTNIRVLLQSVVVGSGSVTLWLRPAVEPTAQYVMQSGSAQWGVNLLSLDGSTLGAPTTWGTPPTGNIVMGVNANVLNTVAVTATDNITEWAGSTLGGPTTYGTPPTGEEVIGVNAFITNTVAVSQSGTWNIGTLTSITNPVAVTGTFWQATQPVSIANLSFTAYGSPAQQGANVYVLNPVAVSNQNQTTGGLLETAETGAPNGGTNQVLIGSTGTLIVASRATRRGVLVTNLGTTDVYIGFSSGVMTSNGQLLPGTRGATLTIPTTSAVYGVVSASASPPSDSVSYMEVYD